MKRKPTSDRDEMARAVYQFAEWLFAQLTRQGGRRGPRRRRRGLRR